MQSSKSRFRQFLREPPMRFDADAEPHRLGEPINTGPEARPKDASARRRYWRQYLGLVRPFLGGIALVLVVAIATAMTSLVLPRATMYIVDELLTKPRPDALRLLNLLGAGLLVLTFLQQGMDWVRNWNTARLNARIQFRLRQKLFRHLLRQPLHVLYNLRTGGIVSRLSGDVDAVSNLLQMAIITPIVAGSKILMTVAVLLLLNWKMALVASMLIPPIIAINMIYLKQIRPIYRSIRRDRNEIDGRVVEVFGGIRVVRSFGRDATEERRYGLAHHTVIRKTLRARMLEFVVWSAWGLLVPVFSLMIFWFGGSMVLSGSVTVGGLIAFNMYAMLLLMPVTSIVQSYGETQQALAAMERVFDLLQRPIDKPDRPGARPAPRRVERIELDGVTFGYSADRPILREISLDVPAGWTVALVGESGAGKTTLTNLIARFYDPDHGAIRVNGVDLRDLKLRSFRRLLGFVQQDTFLFDGTIAENIAYGRRGATQEQIEAAARRANAHEFIEALPEKYVTRVGERGVKLSGGQAQRISIARAILADPQILILDEATSNLDTESEQAIQAALEALLANRTTFVIAHRLSTVLNADLIVVLDEGRVVETGTHESLMSGETRYRAMVERQQRGLDYAAPSPAFASS